MKRIPIRVLLVDDEPLVLEQLRQRFLNWQGFEVAGAVRSMEEAVTFLQTEEVQLAFLDIQMKGKNGFALASYIRKYFPQILMVFLTGHAGFALEGYDYEPVDFLVKPIINERFAQTLKRVERKLAGISDETRKLRIGFYTDKGYCLYDVENILYLEKEERKVSIVDKSGEGVRSGNSMLEMEEILTDYGFFRCHQSYLVPLSEILGIEQERFGRAYRLSLRGTDKKIPLSRRRYYELKEILQRQGTRIY